MLGKRKNFLEQKFNDSINPSATSGNAANLRRKVDLVKNFGQGSAARTKTLIVSGAFVKI